MGRLAKADDPVFRDQFFIEDYDLRNWEALAVPLKTIVLAEAAKGNKVLCTTRHQSPSRIVMQLMAPAQVDWSQLPDGAVMRSGYTAEFPVYDTDLYAIFDLASGDYIAFGDPEAWASGK